MPSSWYGRSVGRSGVALGFSFGGFGRGTNVDMKISLTTRNKREFITRGQYATLRYCWRQKIVQTAPPNTNIQEHSTAKVTDTIEDL